jgi:hypothetical protein
MALRDVTRERTNFAFRHSLFATRISSIASQSNG